MSAVLDDKTRNQALIQEVLEAYPEKAAKKRAKHLNVYEEGKPDCGVKSNIKSLPGVMTIRGCAYAGSKGVVWGPIKDMVHISHGPVGCGQYSWGTRRNYASGTVGVDNFTVLQVTSDFQEKDIVFGGDKKLDKVIDEITEIFPLARGISIQSECPIGLIGDDIEAVAKKKQVVIQIKEIKVRPKTDDHDYDTKVRHIRRFIEEGDRCKVTVFFRGREIVHKDRGQSILDRIVEDTKDIAKMDQEARAEGRTLQMMLVPKKQS